MKEILETKHFILDTALGLVRTIGYEGISIGALAKKVGMSKSGVFAHFKSKETLQTMILDYAAGKFVLEVIRPSLKTKRGVQRLKIIIANWITWSLENHSGSCPLIRAAIEYDDRPGLVKDTVTLHLSTLHSTLARAVEICIEEGEFNSKTDSDLVAQEIFGLILSNHLYKKTLNDKNAQNRFQISVEHLFIRYKA